MIEFSPEILADLPERKDAVFFNHAGVSPLARRSARVMREFIEEMSNPARIDSEDIARRIKETRTLAAGLINASPEEVSFVRSTTHGLAIVAEGLAWKPGDNMITFSREFPANIYPWLHLRRRGVEVRMVEPREGRMLLEDIAARIDQKTRLISVSSVQFTNGFRIDLPALGKLCKERGLLLCVDAIQSLGVFPMDVKACGIDFLSADGHKWLLGPEGLGLMYVRRELLDTLTPPIVGWLSVIDPLNFLEYNLTLKPDASRFEEGSHNALCILGLGGAIAALMNAGLDNLAANVLEITDRLADGLIERGATIISPRAKAAPEERSGILSFHLPRDPGQIASGLKKQGIILCVRDNALRASPHGYNTITDVERFFSVLDRLL